MKTVQKNLRNQVEPLWSAHPSNAQLCYFHIPPSVFHTFKLIRTRPYFINYKKITLFDSVWIIWSRNRGVSLFVFIDICLEGFPIGGPWIWISSQLAGDLEQELEFYGAESRLWLETKPDNGRTDPDNKFNNF